MKLKIKDMDIATGGIVIAIMNHDDAQSLDLHPGDRVMVKHGQLFTTAILDTALSGKAVPRGHVGVFEELITRLKLKKNSEVEIFLVEKPDSVRMIRKKLYGYELTPKELHQIVSDVANNNLTDIELTYFVAAGYTRGWSMAETVALTKAMISVGDTLDIKKRPILDKHCIGGVAGNRTTPVVVSILAAAGFTVPKTSSRAITSPAGTADTMEVIADVALSKERIQEVVAKTGACLAWGGSVHLAPADDQFISVEHPIGIDSEGQLLASVMAKKGSAGATHVLIDIPVGPGAKVKSRKDAQHLARKFKKVGKALGIKVLAVITDGRQPIGNGIGPALEARDILRVLKNDKKAPKDLKEKCVYLAAQAMKLVGGLKSPDIYARDLLESGAAYKKFLEIVNAQGARITNPNRIQLAKHSFEYKATKSGKIIELENKSLSRVARVAGAPEDKKAGIYLHKHVGDAVKKGDVVFTIYAQSRHKLAFAKKFFLTFDGVKIR